MRKLVYYIAVSIDGHIAAPDGSFDAFPLEGDHAPVLTEEFADALPSDVLTMLNRTPPGTRFDTVIMGWNTYDTAAAVGSVSPYAHLRQIVATRRPREVPSEIELTDDPVRRIRELKAAEGLDIYLSGGGELAGRMIDEIDHLVIKRNPLAFGSGIPLFGHTPYRPVRFAHRRTRTFDSGVSVQEYTRPAD